MWPAWSSSADRVRGAGQTKTFRTGPIKVGSYQVKQSDLDASIPTPKIDGYITEMDVEVVDAAAGRSRSTG